MNSNSTANLNRSTYVSNTPGTPQSHNYNHGLPKNQQQLPAPPNYPSPPNPYAASPMQNFSNPQMAQRRHSQSQMYGSLASLISNNNYADVTVQNNTIPYPFAVGNQVNSGQNINQNQRSSNYANYPTSPNQGFSAATPASKYLPPSPSNTTYGSPLEYGLPSGPTQIQHLGSPRRFVSPQNSNGSNSGSPLRAPPPYRPPPPAAYGGSPTSLPMKGTSVSRRSSVSGGTSSAMMYGQSRPYFPSVSHSGDSSSGLFQHQRSVSGFDFCYLPNLRILHLIRPIGT